MRYEFAYEPRSPYGHLVDLLVGHVPVGTVIDLGCGHAAIAPALIDRGYQYIGADVDPATVEALAARGIEAHRLDLADTATLVDGIVALGTGRGVVAVTALDVVEHLPRPVDALRAVHQAMTRLGADWLGVSIPNVAHVDLAGKLMAGRWDVTPTGLLDDTHVSLFTATRLRDDMRAAGFDPGPAKDFHLEYSDQHFPADLATLAPMSPLGRLVREVRGGADAHATTNQFVRLFRRTEGAPTADTPTTDGTPSPFLSVVVRTTGNHATLHDTLAGLAAQTCADLEVLLVVDTDSDDVVAAVARLLSDFTEEFAARVHAERTPAGHGVLALNRAVDLARGRYLAVLDEGQLVLDDWVQVFRDSVDDAAALLRSRAEVRRAGTGDADPTTSPEPFTPARFDLVDHLGGSRTPIHTVALPMSVFRDLGLRFDPEMAPHAELTVVLEAAQWCGVADTEAVTAIHVLRDDDSMAPSTARLIDRLDRRPMLLPEGSATRLSALLHESGTDARAVQPTDTVADARARVMGSADLRSALAREGVATRTAVLLEELAVQRDRADQAEARIEALERSRYWRATEPVRSVVARLRRLVRRH